MIHVAAVLQAQRLPWGAVIVSALVVILGVFLLVYLIKRLKTSDKETEEEDWNSSRKSLFVSQPQPQTHVVSEAEQAPEAGREHAPQSATPVSSAVTPLPILTAESETSPGPIVGTEAPHPSASVQQERSESPGTQVTRPIGSPVPATGHTSDQHSAEPSAPAAPQPDPAGFPFEDEVWAALEVSENQGALADRAAHPAGEFSVHNGSSTEWLPGQATSAEQNREPYDPPRIEPITPGSRTPAKAPMTQRKDQQPSLAAAERGPRPEAHFSKGISPVSAGIGDASPGEVVRAERKSGGSVLGLPSNVVPGQLVLGQPKASEIPDVGTISNYGKAQDDGGGHGGTVALLTVVFIIAVAVLAYFFVAPVHSSVNAFVARAKGEQPPEKIRAQVFPGRIDGTKNPVQVKGTVQNISDETLNDLSIVLTLEPIGGSAPDTQTVPVKPPQLAPSEQGTFEFELDAKRYRGYRPVKLVNKEGFEIKSAIPKQ
jgi:hypothetical protein